MKYLIFALALTVSAPAMAADCVALQTRLNASTARIGDLSVEITKDNKIRPTNYNVVRHVLLTINEMIATGQKELVDNEADARACWLRTDVDGWLSKSNEIITNWKGAYRDIYNKLASANPGVDLEVPKPD